MRFGVVFLILTILAAPLAVEAPPAGKVPRVGLFEERLRKLGYVDGRSIAIESRTSAGSLDLLPGLAAELVRQYS